MLVCAAFTLACLVLAAPKALSETAAEDLIRLHVVAESDSAWDQAVKLAVRDAVRQRAAALLEGCETAEEAWTRLNDGLDQIGEAARAALSEWGPACEAAVSAGVYEFPERVYGSLTVPAGEYRALRVVLGEGEGKNWWCVLFPSLCLPEDADSATPVVFYSSLGRWLARLFGGNGE